MRTIRAPDHSECLAVSRLKEGIGHFNARRDDMPARGTSHEVWIRPAAHSAWASGGKRPTWWNDLHSKPSLRARLPHRPLNALRLTRGGRVSSLEHQLGLPWPPMGAAAIRLAFRTMPSPIVAVPCERRQSQPVCRASSVSSSRYRPI